MTEHLDQNTLIAYLDGELDDEAVRAVERRLRLDETARLRLDALQKSAALARIAFNDVLHAPVPERLVDTVNAAPDQGRDGAARRPSPASHAPRTKTHAPTAPDRRPRASWRLALPIAATIVGVMIGVGGGYGVMNWRAGKSQEMANALRQHELLAVDTLRNSALESQVSGRAMTWKSPDATATATITPVRTYQDKNGQFCREYRQQTHLQGKANETYGLACRTPDGQWRPRYLISTPKAGSF
ncbi:RT0821/Lpp0805 family surface protein [Varunaivibrio sulfuroxidans]|uniref:Surface antigen n=1 Tax=Varunaivibrio sulfuroxidans TaxID=1773489 RepID=A0A4R3J7S4_9PROT|nr:RT0821/Lpp0805 family surface protein [Varunaivibrio sulfuroxidans]TCS60963.1 surface antigen [Varunaivibrio sulfuroxidans]WES31631.1 RT0821/Lpp0805 family surface protein [Varunaivibrio sulfuroxidans]